VQPNIFKTNVCISNHCFSVYLLSHACVGHRLFQYVSSTKHFRGFRGIQPAMLLTSNVSLHETDPPPWPNSAYTFSSWYLLQVKKNVTFLTTLWCNVRARHKKKDQYVEADQVVVSHLSVTSLPVKINTTIKRRSHGIFRSNIWFLPDRTHFRINEVLVKDPVMIFFQNYDVPAHKDEKQKYFNGGQVTTRVTRVLCSVT